MMILRVTAAVFFMLGMSESVWAQVCGCPTYSMRRQVVQEEQFETRYRVVYDTVYEERDVVSQVPVLKTRMEKRSYTVTKPVVETSTVQERYTVKVPVTKREWIDRSYYETSYVSETEEVQQSYTTFRPVTETQYQTRDYVVNRPVSETQYQTQQYVTYSPVTTYGTAVVDQGQYYAQQYYQPGDTRYGLRWLRGGYTTNMYGSGYRRGGLGWVPYTSPGTTYAQLNYRPNPVQVAVPQTQMVPQVQQQQVPVQVTRMESQVVQQQVPVTTTRMEAVQEMRSVPRTVQRPVTRLVQKAEPVDRTEWVDQEMVRPKTVRRTTYKLETVEKEVPIQYYETNSVTTKVKVPRRVARYEPYVVRRLVPRVVETPVRLNYFDPYSVPLSSSSWISSPVSSSTGIPAPSETVTYGAGKPAAEIDSEDQLPERKFRKIDPGTGAAEDGSSESAEPTDGDAASDPESVGEGLDLSPSSNDAI